jgi:hypothetical protein
METTRPSAHVEQPHFSRRHLINFREATINKLLNTPQSQTLNPLIPGVEPIELDPHYPGQEILQSVLQFKAAAFSADGLHVDYISLAKDPAFIRYKRHMAPALRKFDPNTIITTDHKIAFWSNLYNALIIDAVISFKVEKSVTEKLGILKFFRKAAYNIGGQRLSAEEIEHGILRANVGHPYFPGPQFATDDPRKAWALPGIDPRIHFALNCASKSCPPIGTYSPERVSSQLDIASLNFVENETEILKDKNEVRTSKIFQWYASDFGDREGIIEFLLNHLPDSAAHSWLSDARQSVRLKFNAYDWKLNT